MPKRATQKAKKTVKRAQKKRAAKPDGLQHTPRTKVRVIGIGGGGCSIVSEVASDLKKADFVCANTDEQALKTTSRKTKTFAFGRELTGGLGSGMNPQVGEQAARDASERISRLLENQDICILVASLGGGTGTGAAPVFAEAAKAQKRLTVGIFTLPFAFEGEKRRQTAQEGLEKLKPLVNAYVVIPNDRIFEVVSRETPLPKALSALNSHLASSLGGIIETVSVPGLINIDFADLRSVLEGRGRLAYLNSAVGTGELKASEGVRDVLADPLADYRIEGADRILFNITSDRSLRMHEVAQISREISQFNPRARIIFGISFRPDFKNKLRITLFATGCDDGGEKRAEEPKKKRRKKRRTPPRPAEPPKEEPEKKPVPVKKKKPAPKKRRVPSLAVPIRRSALEVKKEVDKELAELEEEERKWEVPAFLRNQ